MPVPTCCWSSSLRRRLILKRPVHRPPILILSNNPAHSQHAFRLEVFCIRLTRSTLLVVLCVSLTLGAFGPPTLGQEPASATGRSEQSEASLAPGSAILAELNSSVDSKKVKAGDPIVAHTFETLKSTDDRTIVPKGTKIEGHITQASARGKGGEESALGIQLDKVVLKEGGEISLNVVIRALAA